MYVSRGMGAVRRLPLPMPVFRRGRGFGGVRGLGLDCPPGQSPTNMYDGTVKCCGGPAATDPCGILNNPGFIAAQNTRVEQDITDLGPDSAAAALAGVPINIGQAAVFCSNHPGNNYADPISGKTIQCPAGGHQDLSGATWSNYTIQQLAAMLNAQYGGAAPTNPGNLPYTQGGGELVPSSGVTPTVRLVNSSGGSNSSFKVGDSWQIVVTGQPNAQVTASASQNGSSLGTTPMGTIGSNGSLTLTGTFGAAQVGNWVEQWKVGGVAAGSLSFSVAAPSAGSGGGGQQTGGGDTSGGSTSNFLNQSVSVGGTTIPTWALIAAGVGAVFLLGGRH